MRVLFLDIDGVLNSYDWTTRRQPGPPEGLTPQARSARAFDPAAVALLREIIERSGAALVFSSTWRLDGGFGYVELLRALGLCVRFLGSTPDGSRMHAEHRVTRGSEIACWLWAHSSQIDSVAILDDDDDMGALTPWLVRTSFERGLQREHVEQAVELLARERDDALRLAWMDQRAAIWARS